MSHLVRASAALAVLALALPAGAAAKVAKPRHTTTSATRSTIIKTVTVPSSPVTVPSPPVTGPRPRGPLVQVDAAAQQ